MQEVFRKWDLEGHMLFGRPFTISMDILSFNWYFVSVRFMSQGELGALYWSEFSKCYLRRSGYSHMPVIN